MLKRAVELEWNTFLLAGIRGTPCKGIGECYKLSIGKFFLFFKKGV